MIETKWNRVFLTLGSNILPEIHLQAAIDLLDQSEQVNVIKVSRVWESAPVGYLDQAPFCNAAVLAETEISPQSLKFDVLRNIEQRLLRVRDPANKNGPRTIDLDIALFGDLVVQDEKLIIPDPEISQRAFMAIPLAELDPEFVHPTIKETLKQIAKKTGARETLKRRKDIILHKAE